MVKETRITIGLSDLENLRIECLQCGAEVLLKMEPGPNTSAMPDACPLCHGSWISGSRATDRTRALVHTLLHIREEVTHPLVKLKFEVVEE